MEGFYLFFNNRVKNCGLNNDNFVKGPICSFNIKVDLCSKHEKLNQFWVNLYNADIFLFKPRYQISLYSI